MSPVIPKPLGAPADHAVSRLRTQRLAASSKPFVARGANIHRCTGCRLPPGHCICSLRPQASAQAGFCLLLGDIEALKPTNTGWLIADVVPDTWAFQLVAHHGRPGADWRCWTDPQWQPCVVFPPEYAAPSRVVSAPAAPADTGRKRPLFILLDGTWSEATQDVPQEPVPGQPRRCWGCTRSRPPATGCGGPSQDHHFCTAEIGALCLDLAGDAAAAEALDAWFGRVQRALPDCARGWQRPLDRTQRGGRSGCVPSAVSISSGAKIRRRTVN